MKQFLGNRKTIALAVILVICVIIYNIFVRSTPFNTGMSGDSIDGVDVEFYHSQFYLVVHLNKSITCQETIKALKMESFNMKDKTYTPTCSHIGGSLIKIIYTEVES